MALLDGGMAEDDLVQADELKDLQHRFPGAGHTQPPPTPPFLRACLNVLQAGDAGEEKVASGPVQTRERCETEESLRQPPLPDATSDNHVLSLAGGT